MSLPKIHTRKGFQALSHNNTIFNQLLQIVPRHDFENLVAGHQGDRYVKGFHCWQQFITMLYAQIKGHDSLRDITTALSAHQGKLYHIGLGSVARSTLADANEKRDWRIFEGLFYHMLEHCRSVTPKHKFRFKNPLYSLDASLIEVCYSMFPWARYRATKGALKIHCLLDHRGCLPSFLVVTEGNRYELRVAKELDLPLLPDSILSFDRGYMDFGFFHSLLGRRVCFVTRAKRNLAHEITGQHEKPNVKGLVDDVRIRLKGRLQLMQYPEELRLVTWLDEETGRELRFLTNNFNLAASTIAAIYKARWQIELFFKWIKQNLKIKSFLGTSFNAVMIQIWVAMCYYLLVAYVKYQTRYKFDLLALTRIFREILMERVSLIDILSLNPYQTLKKARAPTGQLALF
jgi:hypothetical protein